MIALARREFHEFQAAGRQFVYLVPSAAVFELDAPCAAVLLQLVDGPRSEDALIEALSNRFPAPAVREAIRELLNVRAIGYEQRPAPEDEPIKQLLRKHRSRPIGARVTLTSETLDVTRIYRHLTEEFGFWEVGFAPVTTSPNLHYAIGEQGFDRMLGQFRELAAEFAEHVAANRHHGFSHVGG